MATDGPDPSPCIDEIYRNGRVMHQIHGISSNRMEGWVKKIAAESGQPVDWHFAGGWAIVKALGDFAAVGTAIGKHLPELAELQRASAPPHPSKTEER